MCRILEVLDKGKAAAVTMIVETKDKSTGKTIFENQQTLFIRGSGGFGGKRSGKGESLLHVLLEWLSLRVQLLRPGRSECSQRHSET